MTSAMKANALHPKFRAHDICPSAQLSRTVILIDRMSRWASARQKQRHPFAPGQRAAMIESLRRKARQNRPALFDENARQDDAAIGREMAGEVGRHGPQRGGQHIGDDQIERRLGRDLTRAKACRFDA